MEDVDYIVVVFEAFDEAVDVFLLLGREFAHGEGDALELKGLDFEAVVFEVLGDGTVVFEVGIDHDFVFVAEDLVDVVVDELEFEFVHVDALFVGDDKGAFALEEEVVHAHGAELAFAADEGGADVGDGARGVVGGCFDDEGGTVGAFAVIDYLFVGGLVFLGGALDGAFDVLFRHALALGGGHEQAETEIAGGVGAAGKYGEFDFFSDFGEGAGHVSPPFQLACFAIFKRSSHKFDIIIC